MRLHGRLEILKLFRDLRSIYGQPIVIMRIMTSPKREKVGVREEDEVDASERALPFICRRDVADRANWINKFARLLIYSANLPCDARK